MKLPRLSGQEVIKVLSKSGFKPVRQRGKPCASDKVYWHGKNRDCCAFI